MEIHKILTFMNIIKIVVTGGPSGGKTTLIEALKRELGNKVAIVPEAASILYKGGFPRMKTDSARRHTQRAIYFTQKELELLVSENSNSSLIVCDRGSLDSIAYWPSDETNFLTNLNTTREYELARYDWVLHLDTASQDYYEHNNGIRLETFAEAQELNEKVLTAWRGHPKRIIIGQDKDFLKKMTTSTKIIEQILSGKSYEFIKDMI